MTVEELREYVERGSDIEFEYKGKQYSITWSDLVDKNDCIYFYEFYKESTAVKTVDELLKVERDGITVEEMITSCKDEDFWIE